MKLLRMEKLTVRYADLYRVGWAREVKGVKEHEVKLWERSGYLHVRGVAVCPRFVRRTVTIPSTEVASYTILLYLRGGANVAIRNLTKSECEEEVRRLEREWQGT